MARALAILLLLAIGAPAFGGSSIFDDDWGKGTPSSKPKPTAPPPAANPPVVTPPTVTPDPSQPSVSPPSTPAQPSPSASQSVDPTALRPVPPDAAFADSWKTVNEVFKEEIAAAKGPDRKCALARKLLEAAQTDSCDAARYALCMRAMALAVDAGDCAIACAAIDELRRTFIVDDVQMLANAIAGAAKNATTSMQRKQILAWAETILDRAIAGGRYDVARAIAQVAISAATVLGDTEHVKSAEASRKRASDAEAAYAIYKTVSVILTVKPNDPDANLKAGKFLCFVQGDWDAGLPKLALGSDPALAALATKDGAAVSNPDARLALGNEWWDLAQKEPGAAKRQMQARAAKWYTEALPELNGLARAGVEKKLSSLGIKPAPVMAAAAAGVANVPGNPEADRAKEIAAAIARHDLIPGMTVLEARRAARLPCTLFRQDGNTKIYRWTIKGRTGTEYVRENGFHTTYTAQSTYGVIGYVDATFVDDVLVSAERTY